MSWPADAKGNPYADPFPGVCCGDCHTKEELHGYGTEYNSIIEPGAIKAIAQMKVVTQPYRLTITQTILIAVIFIALPVRLKQ